MPLDNRKIEFSKERLNKIPVPVIILNDREEVTWINDAFQILSGYSLTDLKASRRLPFLSVEHEKDFKYLIRQTFLGNSLDSFNIPVKNTDNTTRDILWNTILIPGDADPRQKVVISMGVEPCDHNKKQTDLEIAEAQYRVLFENTGISMMYIGDDTKIALINKKFEKLTGYSKLQVEGKRSWMELIADKQDLHQMRLYHRLRRIDPDLAPDTYDTMIRTKDGDIRNIMLRVAMIPGTAFSLASMLDVTDKRLAEDALRKSEESYRTLVENMQDTLYRCDIKGDITFVSPSGVRLLGFDSVKELIGKNIAKDFYYNPAERSSLLNELKANGKVTNFEVTLKRKDGNPLNVSTNSQLFYDKDGQVLGVEGIFSDITERKKTEKMLLEKKEQLHGITRNIPGVVFQFYAKDNGEYGMSYASERLTELFDLPNDLDGMFETFVSRIYAEDREKFLASVQKAVETCSSWDFEGRLVNPSGDIVWIHAMSIPARHGDRIVFNGILLNIMERKRTEDALEKRIVALTKPLDDTAGIAFEDLFNIDEIQRLQDEFAQATGVASIITHTDGTPITAPSRFRRFCIDIIRRTEKGRANCYKSDSVLGRLSAKGPAVQPCISGGLWDAGAGISVGGRHIANWLIGQVRDETQTEVKIREYAREIGVDEQELVEAFREVPAMSAEQFRKVAQVLFTLANQLSTLAYQNVQQARFITERKIAEQLSRQSEEKFSKVFMMTPDFITITRIEDGLIIDVNLGFEDITGWKREEVIGRRALDIDFWIDASECDAMVKELKAGRDVLHHEFRFRHKDGSLRIGIYSARSIRIENESCLIFIMQDITERRRLEEDRLKLDQQLSYSLRMDAIGQLAGGVAHDINNILMGIQGNASLMMAEYKAEHPHYQRLNQIEEHVKRGANLTKQLLGFAREGKYEVKVLSINNLIKKSAQLFLETRKEIKVEFQLADDVYHVEVDAGQIEQTLLNIYINAGHAMPKGGTLLIQTRNITLREADARAYDTKEGDYVKISISDTGVGIDNETLNRIFEPFFTTKLQQGGSGMGLASAYGIIRNHGGVINAYSEPGNGATFNIFLPSSIRPAVDEEQPPERGLLSGSGSILIVDDEPMILDTASDLLGMLGYTIYRASSGQEAISIYRECPGKIDLVILDMILPGMTGPQVLKVLKDINPDVNIVLSSGYGLQGEVQKVMEMGCRGFIQKPYNFTDLSKIVHQALNT